MKVSSHTSFFRFSLVLLVLLAVTPLASAFEDFWVEPYSTWNREQAEQMLSNSPWAKTFTLADNRGRRAMPSEMVSGGLASATDRRPSSDTYLTVPNEIPGESELFYRYKVRLFSALPVRQAHLRLMQLDSGYDWMSSSEREVFDRRTSRATGLDVSDRIIVSLEFDSNDRPVQMEVNRQLRELGTQQVKQSVYLISESLERIEILQYFPPSPDGSGVKFIFPRRVGGEPVVSSEDRELKFEFFVPGTDHKVYVVWPVNELMFGGKIDL